METMHYGNCLQCGGKTLIYSNGFCKTCRVRLMLKLADAPKMGRFISGGAVRLVGI